MPETNSIGSFRSADGSVVKEGEPVFRNDADRLAAGLPPEPTPVEPQPGSTAPAEPPAAPAVAPVVEPPVVQVVDWLKISEVAGEKIESESQLQENFKAKRDLDRKLKEFESKFGSLDPLALDIDKAIKSGLDINLYMEARNMNPEKLTAKEAIRKKFDRENPGLTGTLANTIFEDEFETKYGILDQKFNDVEQTDPATMRKLEVAKARLAAEEINSKKFLADWKSKNVTITEPAPAATEEQNAAIREAYDNQSRSFIENMGELGIPVGDSVFNFGMEGLAKDIEQDLKNPIATLQSFGVDLVTGKIDPEKFGEIIAKVKALDQIGKSLSEWALEQSNADHVKAKLDGPVPSKTPAGDPAGKSHDQKVAEAFVAKRLAESQARI